MLIGGIASGSCWVVLGGKLENLANIRLGSCRCCSSR
jgi:hypothetical protein